MNKTEYEAKRTELLNEAQAFIDAEDIENAELKNAEIEKLDNDFEATLKAIANKEALEKSSASEVVKNIIDNGGSNTMDNNTIAVKDMYSSIEYREAFMNSMLTGKPMPSEFRNAPAQTTTSEVGAVIPTTIIQQIFEKIESVGHILPLCTNTNFKGGVSVPTSSTVLSASWVAERSTADTQEYTTTAITFAYNKLICRVAVSFEVGHVTLDFFEAKVAENIAKAMVKKLEEAIIKGTGSANNQPKGILAETVVSGQDVEIAEGSHFTYATLVNAEGALPSGYDATAVWCMSKKTFFGEVIDMKDDNGQPIARINSGIDGKPEYSILGRRVVLTEHVSNFATTVSADTIVAFLFDFSRYLVNTNYAVTLRQYTDESTDDIVTKAIMLVDGKVVDKNSLVTVTVKNG